MMLEICLERTQFVAPVGKRRERKQVARQPNGAHESFLCLLSYGVQSVFSLISPPAINAMASASAFELSANNRTCLSSR